MRLTLILARDTREGGSYAKLVGLERGQYRCVQNRGSITGVRNAEVHILPSFLARRDRHAILDALRWARVEVFYVDPTDFEEPHASAPDPDSGPDSSVDDIKAAMAAELDDDDEKQAELDTSNGANMAAEGAPVKSTPKPRAKPAAKKPAAKPAADAWFE